MSILTKAVCACSLTIPLCVVCMACLSVYQYLLKFSTVHHRYIGLDLWIKHIWFYANYNTTMVFKWYSSYCIHIKIVTTTPTTRPITKFQQTFWCVFCYIFITVVRFCCYDDSWYFYHLQITLSAGLMGILSLVFTRLSLRWISMGLAHTLLCRIYYRSGNDVLFLRKSKVEFVLTNLKTFVSSSFRIINNKNAFQ